MTDYDPLITMSALNMAVVSLHRIITSGSRVILDREYSTIINNLRIGEINPDSELMELYQEIMKVLQNGRLRDNIRNMIIKKDSEKKQKSIKEIIMGNVLKSFSSNPLKWIKKLAMLSASEYFIQQKEIKERAEEVAQNNNDTQIRLECDELKEYGELQQKLLSSSWRLLHKYNVTDKCMLNPETLEHFSAAMNEYDPSNRQQMMNYLESYCAMYAPYWFYRAKAADESGNDDEAEKFFERFHEIRRPVLKRDPYLAEAMKFRIEKIMRAGVTPDNVAEILKCLDEMRANIEINDWANNIFVGMIYFTLGMKDEAVKLVKCNVLFKYETDMSRKVLDDMETGELPPRINLEMALMLAAKYGHAESAELLLKYGANVNAHYDDGWTALMYTAKYGHKEVTGLLLKHGADVNAKYKNERTALTYAVKNGYKEIVELLLNHGADVSEVEASIWSPAISSLIHLVTGGWIIR